jgi:betaine-aldehyde dehydrogenase
VDTTTSIKNFVGGEPVDPADGRFYDLVNPATGETFAQAPMSSKADVDRAFEVAERAFEVWRDTTPSQRQLALLKIADAIEERAEELVRAEVENTGKPYSMTMEEEIPPMADQIRFFAGAARVLEGKSAGEYLEGYTSFIRREPVGVCAQVTPWNYPMMMAVWKFAPAIAAGNTVVLKPSDTTPVTTVMLAEIAAEFLPEGVLNVVCGDRDTGRALVGHPTPQMVSTSSGRTWSWAARPLLSSSTTPTWKRRQRRSRAPATSTRVRTVPRPPASSPRPGLTTTSSPRSPSRRRARRRGTRRMRT